MNLNKNVLVNKEEQRMELEQENSLGKEIQNEIPIEEASLEKQTSFLQTSLGKVINTRIGCRTSHDFARFN